MAKNLLLPLAVPGVPAGPGVLLFTLSVSGTTTSDDCLSTASSTLMMLTSSAYHLELEEGCLLLVGGGLDEREYADVLGQIHEAATAVTHSIIMMPSRMWQPKSLVRMRVSNSTSRLIDTSKTCSVVFSRRNGFA